MCIHRGSFKTDGSFINALEKHAKEAVTKLNARAKTASAREKMQIEGRLQAAAKTREVVTLLRKAIARGETITDDLMDRSWNQVYAS